MKFLILLLLPFSSFAFTVNGNYQLKEAELNYHVHYLYKHAEGKSSQIKGKLICKKSHCDIIVASPIKSFTSKDNNRDIKMRLFAKAATYPMVMVKASTDAHFSESKKLDLIVSFAGKEKTYKQVDFKISGTEKSFNAKGTLPFKLEDFDVERPSLMGISIKEIIPVDIDLTWTL